MYTYEQRMTAVKLYIKYFHKAAAVIRELGYPNRHVLVQWFKEYEATGDLHQSSKLRKKSKYSEEQKQAALQFYQDHGRSITLTVNMLGYPGNTIFKQWLNEAFPDRKKYCICGGTMVEYFQEKKEQAVIDLCARNRSAEEVAQRHGVSRVTLYQWKKQLLSQEQCVTMPKKPTTPKSINAEHIKKAVHRLQLERDVLE